MDDMMRVIINYKDKRQEVYDNVLMFRSKSDRFLILKKEDKLRYINTDLIASINAVED